MRSVVLSLAGLGLAACNPVPAIVGDEGMQVARADQVAERREAQMVRMTTAGRGMVRLAVALPVLAGLALAGCEKPRVLTGDPSVAVLTEAQAAGCTPVKRITTTTGVFGNIGREKAMELARNETQGQVAAAGGNAMVYVTGGPDDPDALFVEARGFRC